MDSRPLPRVFNLLTGEKDPAVEDALLAALPHLRGHAIDAALNLLSERARPPALAALLAASPGFEPPLKQHVYSRLDGLHPGLRALIDSEHFEERSAAIAAIAGASDYKSSYLLADCLRISCPKTRELAAKVLCDLTETLLSSAPGGESRSSLSDWLEKRQRLGEGLSAVINSWDAHLQLGALEAALWLIQVTEKTITERLEQPPSRLLHALENTVERACDPRLAPFVMRCTTIPALKPFAWKCLAQAKDSAFLQAIRDQAWLLRDPAVEHGLRGVPANSHFDKWITAASRSAETAAGVVELISLSGGARDRVVARMIAIRDRGGDPVKSAAFWRLVADESSPATAALNMIASRINDPHSAPAARECKRRQRRDNAAPPPPRETSAASLAITRALNMFVEEHDRLDAAQRKHVAEQLKSLGPELIRQLAHKLDASNGLERAATIRAIRTLELNAEYFAQVCKFVRDADAVVRVAALDALRHDQSGTALRLVQEALNDPEVRVQATAVEVLETLDLTKSLKAVRSKLGSQNSRVRANAIKALWNVELHLAAAELEKMLKDKSPEHRISALWVVEHLRIGRIVDRLGALSRDDTDPRVRARAGRALRRIQKAADWKGAAHAG